MQLLNASELILTPSGIVTLMLVVEGPVKALFPILLTVTPAISVGITTSPFAVHFVIVPLSKSIS